MTHRLPASLSLDLDNKWSYLKTHGDAQWQDYPSYLARVIPRFLDVMDSLEMKMTVFVVGQDAAMPEHEAVLRQIAEAGHELGNHSFHHEPWLHLYRPDQLDEELSSAEEAIFRATGYRTAGFRGPGFSLTDQVLRCLVRRGYLYDGTTFPTFLGPAARAYYFMKSRLSPDEKEERKELFGKFADGFQPLRPFFWNIDDDRLLEIPVTTMPILKAPFHASYLMYLATFSKSAARLWFWKATRMCRAMRVQPSFLLHPLDFLGSDDEPELGFFPGMQMRSSHKLPLITEFLKSYRDQFSVTTMREHAELAVSAKPRVRPIEMARVGAV